MQGTYEPGCGQNSPVMGGGGGVCGPWCSHTLDPQCYCLWCGMGSVIEVTGDEEERLGVRCLKL